MQNEEEVKGPASAVSDAKMNSAASSALKQPVPEQAKPQVQANNTTEQDWKNLKQQNADLNNEIRTTDAAGTLNSQDLPLPLNPDGSLSFFWIDAHEEQFGTDFFLFGKVW